MTIWLEVFALGHVYGPLMHIIDPISQTGQKGDSPQINLRGVGSVPNFSALRDKNPGVVNGSSAVRQRLDGTWSLSDMAAGTSCWLWLWLCL